MFKTQPKVTKYLVGFYCGILLTCGSVTSHARPHPRWLVSCEPRHHIVILFYSHVYISVLCHLFLGLSLWLLLHNCIFVLFLEETLRQLYHSASIQPYRLTQNHYNMEWFFLLTHIAKVKGVERFNNGFSVCVHVCWGFQAPGFATADQQ